MKNRKHKSLNKFRTKIWPSVIGNIVIFLIASVVILLVLAFQIMEIIMTKTGQVDLQLQAVYESCMSDNEANSFGEFAQEMLMGVSGISGIRLLEFVEQPKDVQGNVIYVDGSSVKTVEGVGKEIAPQDMIFLAFDGTCNLYDIEEDLVTQILMQMLKNAIVVEGNDELASISVQDLSTMSEEEMLELLMESGYVIDDSEETSMLSIVDDSDEVLSENDELFSIPMWMAIPIDETELFGESQKGRLFAFRTAVTIYRRDIDLLISSMSMLMTLIIIILVWNIVSTTRIVRQQRNLLNALYTDVVSGGHNMLYLEDKSIPLVKHARDRKYALVSLGMDKYSSFCTCYGAAETEQLMDFLYRHFSRQCSKREIVAATDKAVFAMLLTYNTPKELEKRVLDMVQSAKNAREDQNLVFSIGIYAVKNGIDISTQYHYASVARETVSEENAARLQWFDDKMLEEHKWIHKVESDMERALAAHEFEVYLQPKYSTKEEKLAGAEALVRWIHPEEGLVPPGRFIPIFEKNGFILQLDDYMISEVARLQARWIAEGKHVVPISVNVSRAHFTRKDLAEHICGLIDRFQVPHKVIELELTESAFFDDKEILIDTVNKLKRAGFEISMDDFGAGYSSLNSLKELPLDVLKLDAEFFRGEDKDGRGDLIVSEAIDLAKKLDMRIVAEGIETREQVDALAAKDCDLIQGYYFSKPLPVDEFERRAFG